MVTRLTSRREFMERALRLGAMGLFAPSLTSLQAGNEAGSRWQMRLSTSSVLFSKLKVEEALKQISALGFEAVDIWSAYQGCPHLDEVQARLGPERLRALLEQNNLRLASFSVYVGGYAKYAELLGKCGGGLALRGAAAAAPAGELSSRMKAFIESLKPELELCEKHNSYLAIENHSSTLLNSLDAIKAFVELNRNPRLGLALAPYHLQAAKVAVEEAITAAGGQILFFYAWQKGEGLQQLPGQGEADFAPWLAALGKIDYRGYINPFMHNEPDAAKMAEALAKSSQYLKACYDRAFLPAAMPLLPQPDFNLDPTRRRE